MKVITNTSSVLLANLACEQEKERLTEGVHILTADLVVERLPEVAALGNSPIVRVSIINGKLSGTLPRLFSYQDQIVLVEPDFKRSINEDYSLYSWTTEQGHVASMAGAMGSAVVVKGDLHLEVPIAFNEDITEQIENGEFHNLFDEHELRACWLEEKPTSLGKINKQKKKVTHVKFEDEDDDPSNWIDDDDPATGWMEEFGFSYDDACHFQEVMERDD